MAKGVVCSRCVSIDCIFLLTFMRFVPNILECILASIFVNDENDEKTHISIENTAPRNSPMKSKLTLNFKCIHTLAGKIVSLAISVLACSYHFIQY